MFQGCCEPASTGSSWLNYETTVRRLPDRSKVLNALESGAPQDRERVFLVGFLKKWLRKNIDLDIPVEHDNWFHVLSSLEKGSQPELFPAWDS